MPWAPERIPGQQNSGTCDFNFMDDQDHIASAAGSQFQNGTFQNGSEQRIGVLVEWFRPSDPSPALLRRAPSPPGRGLETRKHSPLARGERGRQRRFYEIKAGWVGGHLPGDGHRVQGVSKSCILLAVAEPNMTMLGDNRFG